MWIADWVSTHSRLKAAGNKVGHFSVSSSVSTHSRLKAAGFSDGLCLVLLRRFNTQPPEGGWVFGFFRFSFRGGFNTQPPEGGWLLTSNALFYIA